jgi:hypothetical protein
MDQEYRPWWVFALAGGVLAVISTWLIAALKVPVFLALGTMSWEQLASVSPLDAMLFSAGVAAAGGVLGAILPLTRRLEFLPLWAQDAASGIVLTLIAFGLCMVIFEFPLGWNAPTMMMLVFGIGAGGYLGISVGAGVRG